MHRQVHVLQSVKFAIELVEALCLYDGLRLCHDNPVTDVGFTVRLKRDTDKGDGRTGGQDLQTFVPGPVNMLRFV